MADIKDRAREYLAKNLKYSEVYGEFFVAVDTMTAMIEFAEQETKELKEQIERLSKHILELQKDKGELIDKVRELEKENAKLKEKLKPENCLKLLAKEGYIKFTNDQLTKAKEYIKLLLMNCVGVYESTGKTIAEIQAEAEQFLNGE